MIVAEASAPGANGGRRAHRVGMQQFLAEKRFERNPITSERGFRAMTAHARAISPVCRSLFSFKAEAV
jgi:hypothetical protein